MSVGAIRGFGRDNQAFTVFWRYRTATKTFRLHPKGSGVTTKPSRFSGDTEQRPKPFACIRKRGDPFCSFARCQEGALPAIGDSGAIERTGLALTHCAVVGSE